MEKDMCHYLKMYLLGEEPGEVFTLFKLPLLYNRHLVDGSNHQFGKYKQMLMRIVKNTEAIIKVNEKKIIKRKINYEDLKRLCQNF
jgi:hypothetical protein